MKQIPLKHSIAWVVVEAIVVLVSSVATIFLLARIIGPSAFGVASLAFFIGSFAEIFVAVLFTDALIRRPQNDTLVSDTAFTSMFLASIAIFALLTALAFPIARLYAVSELAPLIIVQALTSLLLGVRGVPEALLARKLRFRSLSIRGICAKLLGSAVTIGTALSGAGAWALILGNVTFALVATALVWLATTRRPKLRFDFASYRELLAFGRFSFAETFFGSLTPRVFATLVGYFGGVTAAGQIGLALRINDAVGSLIGASTMRIALPVFSRLAVLSHEELIRGVMRGGRVTFAVAAPVFVGMALTSDRLVSTLMGPNWTTAAPSLISVNIFSLLYFATVMSAPVMKALGRPGRAAIVPAAGFVFVSVFVVATQPLGDNWALIVWIGFGVLFLALSAQNLKQVVGISYGHQFRNIAGAMLSVGCMSVGVLLVAPLTDGMIDAAGLPIIVIVGAVTYLGTSLVFQKETLKLILGGGKRNSVYARL